MVNIAIAGSSGNVAQEVLDALVARGGHDILLLSRKDLPADAALPSGVKHVMTDYTDTEGLAVILKDAHTVLSFITTASDPNNQSQKNLIDASVQAGVKRFAPSEWASSNFEYMPWYAGKAEIREYLEDLNKDQKVLEYCLFQAGMFTNYFTHPYKSSTHVHPFQTQIDFFHRRALTIEGTDSYITLTTAQDLANVTALAVEYEGEWPVVGGIKGEDLTVNQIIALGEKIRGAPFTVEVLQANDLKNGVVKASWMPRMDHPSVPPEQIDQLAAAFLSGAMMGIGAEALRVGDEWNRLLPEYEFTGAEDFLTEAWSQHVE